MCGGWRPVHVSCLIDEDYKCWLNPKPRKAGGYNSKP